MKPEVGDIITIKRRMQSRPYRFQIIESVRTKEIKYEHYPNRRHYTRYQVIVNPLDDYTRTWLLDSYSVYTCNFVKEEIVKIDLLNRVRNRLK